MTQVQCSVLDATENGDYNLLYFKVKVSVTLSLFSALIVLPHIVTLYVTRKGVPPWWSSGPLHTRCKSIVGCRLDSGLVPFRDKHAKIFL